MAQKYSKSKLKYLKEPVQILIRFYTASPKNVFIFIVDQIIYLKTFCIRSFQYSFKRQRSTGGIFVRKLTI